MDPVAIRCRHGELGGGWEPKQGNVQAHPVLQPASGFWIINPGKLIGNSIGGCQGVGRAYWYVPPKTAGNIYGRTWSSCCSA